MTTVICSCAVSLLGALRLKNFPSNNMCGITQNDSNNNLPSVLFEYFSITLKDDSIIQKHKRPRFFF